MKKFISLCILLFFLLTFSSCSFRDNKKPEAYYYTNKIICCFNRESTVNCYSLDTNYYKKIQIKNDDLKVVKNFLGSLKPANFKDASLVKDKTPLYKVYLQFKKEEYIINVYDSSLVSIYPYDGIYAMDIVDCTGIYTSYNLFSLMQYIYLR